MTTTKILKVSQVAEQVGLKRASVYARTNPNSPSYDPSFPKPIKLGAGARASGFVASEVEAWLDNVIKLSRP